VGSLTVVEDLSADRRLQRVRFGDDVEVTANFADEPRAGLRGGCVEVRTGDASPG
jgi:hypothetical protein